MKEKRDSTRSKRYGPLAKIGATSPARLAMLLPERYEDFTYWNSTSFGLWAGQKAIVVGHMVDGPHQSTTRNQVRLTTVEVELEDRVRITATWIGDTHKILPRLKSHSRVNLFGTVSRRDGRYSLSDPEIVDDCWIGRCFPVYPRPSRMAQATVRSKVMPAAKQFITRAAAMLARRVVVTGGELAILERIGADPRISTLRGLLTRAHFPNTVQSGKEATTALDRLAAWVAIETAIKHRASLPQRAALVLDTDVAVGLIPDRLTAEQLAAVSRLRRVFQRPRASSALLCGDVGTGKTYVYLAVAAAIVAAGGRVAVLLPTALLAKQAYAKALSIHPSLGITFVGSGTSHDLVGERMLIGTSAILHREVGALDLVVCDEQQKLGVDQRQALADAGTHQLDVSATAIPRTLALAKYGIIDACGLRHGFAAKTVKSRLLGMAQARALTHAVRENAHRRECVLVIYSAIAKAKTQASAIHSVEGVLAKWIKLFGDEVRVLTGAMKAEDAEAAVAEINAGKAHVVVCTSVVEVGINFPNVRRIVVVNPERFGLTTLHQIRGRLAREGGHGFFDMLLVGEISGAARTRLNVLLETTDGMRIAEADLKLRGAGELSSDGRRQSGASYSILPGRELDEEAIKYMRQFDDIRERLDR